MYTWYTDGRKKIINDLNMGFKKDLERGDEVEYKVLDIIRETYPKADKKKGYFKDYDIEIPEINKTLEVKYDEMSAKTGNIVVEVEFDNKPSALQTTKADFWLFVTPEHFLWITPEALWSLIRFHNYNTVRFIGKGDTLYKRAYLIKEYHIEEMSYPVTKHNLF